jgi:hypothetical protein
VVSHSVADVIGLSLPIADAANGIRRDLNDTRAKAIAGCFMAADPAKVTESLTDLRAGMKQALAACMDRSSSPSAPGPSAN